MRRKEQETTVHKKWLNLHRGGKSYFEIANEVRKSRYIVRSVIKRFKDSDNFQNMQRSIKTYRKKTN